MTDSTAKRFPVLLGLVAAHVVLATIWFAWFALGDGIRGIVGAIVFIAGQPLPFAQGSLLATWAVMSGRGSPLRFSLVVAFLVAVSWATDDAHVTPFRVWLWLALSQLLVTSVPLFLLRFLGLRIHRQPSNCSGPRIFIPQFSILSLLECMVAVAVVFGMIPLLPEPFRIAFTEWKELGVLLLGIVGGNGIIGVAVLWLVLGAGRLWLRVFATICIAAAAAAAFSCFPDYGDFYEFVGILLPVHAVWLFASLAVLRRLGYRIGWRRASSDTVSPEPVPDATIS